MVEIIIRGKPAIIDHYRWKTEDGELKKELDQFLDMFGPSGWDPDPDYTVAKEAIENLGGKIVSHFIPEHEEGLIY